MLPRALITGVAGQDGSYLTELLLERGYSVIGIDNDLEALTALRRRIADHPDARNVKLQELDVTDADGVSTVVAELRPSEIYNLAAQSRVDLSYTQPALTTEVICQGATHLLEAVRLTRLQCRFYQASSAEMFGDAEGPQDEHTSFSPVSPYASAKLHAHHLVGMYRRLHGIHACSGILFNHESPRRGQDFVSRKITTGIAEILCGKRSEIRLGNLSARRDWGHARDHVRAMWLMLNSSDPADYVIATGTSRSVEELVSRAFAIVGLNWRDHVIEGQELMRPADPADLVGDARKAHDALSWRPSVSFESLLLEMLWSDLGAAGVDPAQYPALADWSSRCLPSDARRAEWL